MADKKISALPAATTPLAGTEVLPIVQGGTTDQVSVANLTAGRAVSATGYTATNGGFTSNTGGVHRSNSAAESDSISNLFYVQNAAGTKAFNIQLSSTNVGSAWAYNGSAWLEGWTVTTSGDFKLPANNLVVGTAGKGIDFSANTHAAGMTSELLDWYEEGTWTPGLSFGGANTGIAYVAGYTNGRYTRIGNRVFVQGAIILSSKGSATGPALITGLPFTNLNALDAYPAVALSLRNVTFANQYQAYIIANSTTIGLYEITEAGSVSDITDADFGNSSEVQFSASYCV